MHTEVPHAWTTYVHTEVPLPLTCMCTDASMCKPSYPWNRALLEHLCAHRGRSYKHSTPALSLTCMPTEALEADANAMASFARSSVHEVGEDGSIAIPNNQERKDEAEIPRYMRGRSTVARPLEATFELPFSTWALQLGQLNNGLDVFGHKKPSTLRETGYFKGVVRVVESEDTPPALPLQEPVCMALSPVQPVCMALPPVQPVCMALPPVQPALAPSPACPSPARAPALSLIAGVPDEQAGGGAAVRVAGPRPDAPGLRHGDGHEDWLWEGGLLGPIHQVQAGEGGVQQPRQLPRGCCGGGHSPSAP